jgi:hypothetical protein
VVVVPFVTCEVQLPSASWPQDPLAPGLETRSSRVPLLPEAERTPRAKLVIRPSGSYAELEAAPLDW